MLFDPVRIQIAKAIHLRAADKAAILCHAMHTMDAQIGEGDALVARHPPGSPEFTHGLDLLRRHAEAGVGAAQLSLGHLYSQFQERMREDFARESRERCD